jgi:hypothetical protein
MEPEQTPNKKNKGLNDTGMERHGTNIESQTIPLLRRARTSLARSSEGRSERRTTTLTVNEES